MKYEHFNIKNKTEEVKQRRSCKNLVCVVDLKEEDHPSPFPGSVSHRGVSRVKQGDSCEGSLSSNNTVRSSIREGVPVSWSSRAVSANFVPIRSGSPRIRRALHGHAIHPISTIHI